MHGFIYISHIFPNEMAHDWILYPVFTEVSVGAIRSTTGFNGGMIWSLKKYWLKRKENAWKMNVCSFYFRLMLILDSRLNFMKIQKICLMPLEVVKAEEAVLPLGLDLNQYL